MFKKSAKERGSMGGNERWHPKIPKSLKTGILSLGGQLIECDVLEDKTRIIRQKAFLKAMGRGKIGGTQRKGQTLTNLPVFLTANNLTPYLKGKIEEWACPIIYKGINKQKYIGYDARILSEACKVYVQADDDGILQDNQKKIASVCRAMIYGLATVGIISLVDSATGYDLIRERTELDKILDAYVKDELRPWIGVFPDTFFQQAYKIHGWEYPKTKNHPQCLGNFINKYIYDELPDGVLDELRKKNPIINHGSRKHKHHQFLTEDRGINHLTNQIASITTVMRLSESLTQFKENMEKI